MWSKEQTQILKKLYNNNSNRDISKELNKTLSSINNKAHRLGLKKSENYLKELSEKLNNKRINQGGRDLNVNLLKSIASKYNTKIEFSNGDNSAYTKALKLGILDDICDHMTVMKFSIPQLLVKEIMDILLLACKSNYNDRIAIKPYEIDIYYPDFKLGFEYQGMYWHREGVVDNIKIKHKRCDEIGITLIEIFETSRHYIKDIKEQIINNLELINKVTNQSISSKDVNSISIGNIYKKLYNKEELLSITKNYNTFKDFKENEQVVYRKLLNLNLVDEATTHMEDKRVSEFLSEEEIRNKISLYDNLTEFRLNELNLYKLIKRKKQDKLISHLNKKPYYGICDLKVVINKYNEKCKFINDNYKMYRFIKRNKLTYLLKEMKKCSPN